KSSAVRASRAPQIRRTFRSGLASAASTAWRPQKRGRLAGTADGLKLLRILAIFHAQRCDASMLRPLEETMRMALTGSPRFAMERASPSGQVAEWLKAADCKSARVSVRWFESSPVHQLTRPIGRGACRRRGGYFSSTLPTGSDPELAVPSESSRSATIATERSVLRPSTSIPVILFYCRRVGYRQRRAKAPLLEDQVPR